MKKKFFYLAILITAVILIKVSDEVSADNKDNFKSPESTINYFIDNLKKNNINAMLEACAINESSRQFDFFKLAKRLKAMVFYSFPAPAKYPLFIETNQYIKIATICKQVQLFCYSLLSTVNIEHTIAVESDDQILKFVESVDPSKLAALSIVQVSFPMASIEKNERYIKNSKNRAAIYGAADLTERLVLYKFADKYYTGGFELLKYNDEWKIDALYSSLGNTAVNGSAASIKSVEEFKKIVSK